MNPKTTIVLLVLLVAGLGVFVVVSKKKAPPEETGSLFPTFAREDVDSVSFSFGSRENHLRRSGKSFQVKVGEHWVPASKDKVDEILSDLGSEDVKRRIPGKKVDAQSRKDYGLTPSVGWVQFSLRGKKKRVDFGATSLVKDTRYATLDGSDDVLIVDDSLFKTLLPLETSDLRAKKLTNWEIGDLGKFEVAEGSKVLLAGARDAKLSTMWDISSPYHGVADDPKVAGQSGLLPSLLQIKAEKFVADDVKKSDLSRYGLEKPRYRLTAVNTRKNETLHLLVGNSVPKKIGETYFMKEGSPFVYAGDLTDLLAWVRKPAISFRDRYVTSVMGYAPIDTARVEYRGKSFELKKVSGTWNLTKPERRSLDGTEVDAWIDAIRKLQATGFDDSPNLAALGLDKPQAKITLVAAPKKRATKSKPVVVLLFGKVLEGGGTYVMRGGHPETAYEVGPAALDLVRHGEWRFLAKAVFEAPPDASKIVALRRSHGSVDRSLTKTKGRWQPPKTSATAVGTIVARILGLEAVRWVGPAKGHEAEYGLGKSPWMRLTATFSSKVDGKEIEQVYGLTIGKATTDGRFARALRAGEEGRGVFVVSKDDLGRLAVPLTLSVFPDAPAAADAVSIRLVAGKKTVAFTKSGKEWGPKGVDAKVLEQGLSDFVGLTALNRVGAVKGHEKEYGLGADAALEVTVTFETKNGAATGKHMLELVVGKKFGGGRYARAIRDGVPDPTAIVIPVRDEKLVTSLLPK